jgi:superfamily II DNA helicase RecQ
MIRYVRTRGCRRRILLQYLGERGTHCAGCDRCRSERLLRPDASPRRPKSAVCRGLQMSSSGDESSRDGALWREVDAVV